MNTKLMFSSEKTHWETPDEFFQNLHILYNFQYDLAANEQNKKCNKYIDEQYDSLSMKWHELEGWLWLNPPYGRGITELWVEKCHLEAQQGAKIIALLPTRTDTRWFHNFIYHKYDIKFIKGRLKFLLDGEEQDAAPFPNMIVEFIKK